MKNIFFIISLSLSFCFIACTQNDFDSNITRGTKIPSTTSIAELKASYIKSTDLFSAEIIQSSSQVVINGIVTSTDIEGNIYKYIVIKDDANDGQSIRISIDGSGLAALYPIGQRVSVVMNDLFIGKYGESPQVGVYYARPKDGRVSPGAIPILIVRKCIVAYGEPTPVDVVADTMTIAEIKAASPRSKMDYRLVCIKNAWFTGKGYDYGAPSTLETKDMIFAPGTNGIGYPQSREIQDGSGSVGLPIATSEYAQFAQKPLPASTYKGNITVLVGWYKDKADKAGNYQLTLRTLSDLGVGYNGYLSSIGYTRR